MSKVSDVMIDLNENPRSILYRCVLVTRARRLRVRSAASSISAFGIKKTFLFTQQTHNPASLSTIAGCEDVEYLATYLSHPLRHYIDQS